MPQNNFVPTEAVWWFLQCCNTTFWGLLRKVINQHLTGCYFEETAPGVWFIALDRNHAGKMVLLLDPEIEGEHPNIKILRSFADDAKLCELCGKPCKPEEWGVHLECADREQFLVDSAPVFRTPEPETIRSKVGGYIITTNVMEQS